MDENIQEMQVPLIPSKEEKKWVRSAYNWGGATILIAFAIMNVAAVIVAIIVGVIAVIKNGYSEQFLKDFSKSLNEMSLTMVIANLVGAVISYPTAFFIGCKGLKIKAKSFFSTKGYTLKFILLAIVVGLGVQLLGSTLADLITKLCDYLGIALTTIDTSTKPSALTNILMYVLTCVSAPIFEEMIFRGILLKAFSKVSIKFGIVASAVMFGLYHQNIPQAVNAFLGGLFLGYVAYKAGSIIPAIIIHAALNANGMIWESVTYLCSKHTAETANNIWMCIVAVSALAVLIIFRKRFSLPKNTPEKKKRTFPLFMTSWSIIFAVVLFIANTLLFTVKFK